MDDLPRLQFDDDKGKERPEKEIGDLQKITGPDRFSMIAKKSEVVDGLIQCEKRFLSV
jgi:hypothetical protein